MQTIWYGFPRIVSVYTGCPGAIIASNPYYSQKCSHFTNKWQVITLVIYNAFKYQILNNTFSLLFFWYQKWKWNQNISTETYQTLNSSTQKSRHTIRAWFLYLCLGKFPWITTDNKFYISASSDMLNCKRRSK